MAKFGIEAQGDLAEKSRMAQHAAANVEAVNFNEFTTRDNAPLFDICSERGLESVKGFSTSADVITHLRDLQAPDRWASSTMRGLREKAAAFMEAHAADLQARGAWPKGVPPDAPRERLIQAGRTDSTVVCPDDTIPTEHELTVDITDNAPWWNVWEKPDSPSFGDAVKARVAVMMKRLAGCGKTSAELRDYAEANAEGRQAEVSHGGELAMPQPETLAEAAAEPASSAQALTGPAAEPTSFLQTVVFDNSSGPR